MISMTAAVVVTGTTVSLRYLRSPSVSGDEDFAVVTWTRDVPI